ncbi:MAG: DUF2852 domain-containing protein [Pseudomonadota bacterium]
MSTMTPTSRTGNVLDTLRDLWTRGVETLDRGGKPAWIAATVVLFIFAWPLGLALLAYMIWSGRMGRNCSSRRARSHAGLEPTGNHAFDAYKEETLRRLEEEQVAFQDFMERLRRAKDQAEFDQFMDERRRPAPARTDADA